MTTFFQAILMLVVALVEMSGVPGQETGPRALAIVGLLSFAQAGQVSLAIGVGLAEINTTMITGAVVSLHGRMRSKSATCLLICSDFHPPRSKDHPPIEPWPRSTRTLHRCIPRRMLYWKCFEDV